MEIRHLRYFLEVCQYGSILQASRHIYLSQQALSRAIASLEQELGLTLFLRTPQGLVLTEAGKRMQELAKPVVDSMDTLIEELAYSSAMAKNSIHFGTTSALQFFIPPSSLLQFKNQAPNIHIDFSEHSFDQCEDMVKSGELAAALINGPVVDPGLVAFNLAYRQRVAIISKDSPLSGKSSLRLQDLAGQRLVSNINNRCYDNLCALCLSLGFTPNIQRVSDNSTVYELCSTQGYVGITIDFVLLVPLPHYSNLITLPIMDSELSYPLVLITSPNQYKRKIIQLFIKHCCAIISEKNVILPQYPFYF